MPVKPGVDNVPLSIPFLTLSTEACVGGEIKKHILTPFGFVDICFPGRKPAQELSSFAAEISVVGDIDSWMLDGSMPEEFHQAITSLIKELVRCQMGNLSPGSGQLFIHFKGARLDTRIPCIL